jgi:ribose 5-phosphate isomerase A
MDVKKLAAEKAVDWIKEDMVVGLGTGSTAFWAIERLGERIKEGLRIKAVATSLQTEELARERAIPLLPFAGLEAIDVSIDGADEVDQNGNLIKGGGGALLREKIVAFHTKTYLTVVDESKLVEHLGRFPLPVEIVPFGVELTLRQLEKQFGPAPLRQANGKDFITDNGNLIADLRLFPIADPVEINRALHDIPGVVETGLFLREMITTVMVGRKDGTVEAMSFNR